MPKQKKMWDNILTVIMTLLSLLWIYPIVLILLNSLKIEGTFTTSTVFKLPTAETFAGLSNYVYGVTKMGFLSSLGYSLVITVTSVALILLCCSMTGWYLTRVNNKLSISCRTLNGTVILEYRFFGTCQSSTAEPNRTLAAAISFSALNSDSPSG